MQNRSFFVPERIRSLAAAALARVRLRWLTAPGRGKVVLAELQEGFLEAPGGGGCDALVDGECLPQVPCGLAGVAVLEVAVTDAFQGPCFLQGDAEVAGDG
jgi:hypothetical protein